MSITYNLGGKAALVTGGASGIGLATVELLARAGAAVAVNHLPDDPRGLEVVDRLTAEGCTVISAPGSVAEAAAATRMVDTAIDGLGRLDLLVNNAGTPATNRTIAPTDLDLITEALWRTLIDTNLISVFECTRRAAPALKAAGGAVVSTASISGLDQVGSSMAYGATKAAVISLTKNLARALAPEVRVNAIAPGAVDSTWMIDWTDKQRQDSIDRALLKRRCVPEDLAATIAYLGFGAPMVTGQTIVVDGGLSLGG
ncbi:SDR family oxidoreductase [Acuticoccus sp. M5D2P5]|uniref:SDR family NAD(P)-dependent oxidoreductase n=1 Tax=Acuticoccus kalidii TaxID=2910977 RepID=UPI001F208D63|nr:SDR family oxidoreductase [Acuticoccus kalidii]MCF3935184.1 SDR family oxidoreductase [Acuticoccus kalidii]